MPTPNIKSACPPLEGAPADVTRFPGIELLLDVLRCLPVGVILIDEHDRIVYANPLADEIRGVGNHVGGSLDECHPERTHSPLHTVLKRLRTAPADREHPLVTQRGNRWQVQYARVTGADGRYRGLVWLAQDIAPQKELQRRLLHQERIASVGRMASRIAHQLKNALNVVAGALHNLRASPSPDQAQEMVGIIDDEVGRVLALTDRLRQVTRPLELRRESCDVEALARAVVRDERCRHCCEFELDTPADLPPMSIDAGLVRQLLVNALDNSACAAGPGGRVAISLRLDTRPEGEWLVLEVEDSGSGFAQEVLDHLFEPFVTTRPDGTGLGLGIMREICLLHGGDLEVGSAQGGGARVVARLLAR